MSVQMTVRLSNESAAYIDGLVQRGSAPSRAAALDKLVRRQLRRARAEEDLLRYAATPATEEEKEWLALASTSAADVWEGDSGA